jgi:hypothetical protein
MTGPQYEELCRRFVADQTGMPVEAVRSMLLPNPTRHPESWLTRLGPYRHQVDLCWETWEWLTCCLNIANAKWKNRGKVGLSAVLLLQQVRVKVGAHKAVLITNNGYSKVAERAAADEGIGLLIVRPEFDSRALVAGPRAAIQQQFAKLVRAQPRIYSCAVVQKGTAAALPPAALLGVTAPMPATAGSPGDHCAALHALPAAPCTTSRPTGSSGAGETAGDYSTRHGPGPGYRRK